MPGNKGRKSSKWVKLIINPGSGNPDDSTSRVEQVTRLFMEQGLKVSVALAKPKEKAYIVAKKAVKKGYRLIIAMGGDGTVEAVARALVKTKARLGIIPAGTENNLIAGLGIPDDLEAACRLISEGEHKKIDVGQVRQKGKKRYFLEQTGVGLIATLFPETDELNKGNFNVLGKAISDLVNYQAPRFELTLDGENHVEEDSLLVTVSNFPSFGKKFLVAPTAVLNDGLLDINLYPGLSKTDLAAYFAAIANGGLSDETRIQRYRARKVVIRASPKQEVVADSVMLKKGKVTIRVRKKALRVIAGPLPTLVDTAGLVEPAEMKDLAENKQTTPKFSASKEWDKPAGPQPDPLPPPVARSPGEDSTKQ